MTSPNLNISTIWSSMLSRSESEENGLIFKRYKVMSCCTGYGDPQRRSIKDYVSEILSLLSLPSLPYLHFLFSWYFNPCLYAVLICPLLVWFKSTALCIFLYLSSHIIITKATPWTLRVTHEWLCRMTSRKHFCEPKLKFPYTIHSAFMIMVSLSKPKQGEIKTCILFQCGLLTLQMKWLLSLRKLSIKDPTMIQPLSRNVVCETGSIFSFLLKMWLRFP